MAGTTTIPLEEGSDSSSLEVGLETTDTKTLPNDDATEDVVTLKAERDELKRRNEQYLRERNGWEAQSRRNLDEASAVKERLARLEGAAQGRSIETLQKDSSFTPGQLKNAMHKWLNGEDADLDAVEQALGRSLTHTQTSETSQVKSEDFKRMIREELVDLGTKGNVQSIVGRRHPDLANPQSSLSQAVWQSYDQYVSDPENQLLYARDPQREVPMIGPDGSQRMVDARLVDRLAAELKVSGAIQEGRRQESRAAQVGGTMGGSGQTSRMNPNRSVEATELLSQAEMEYLTNPKTRRGWSKLPAEPKAAAKYYWDGLSEEEKKRRLTEYRSAARRTT